MTAVEQYLKPELAAQIKRLDLRAQMIVRGFLQGLHASPYHGFSVEFSEHRRYTPGDDPKDIDWLAYAKTDRYFVKKFEAETSLQGYLVVDLSRSMDFTYRQQMTKFDYSICLAAALSYLMLMQRDPIGLVTFDASMQAAVPPRSRRSQLATILSKLTKLKATGKTDFQNSMSQLASMLKHRSLIILFSDLLVEQETAVRSLRLLRGAGHDIIVFHILDEAEVTFPFEGNVRLLDPEDGEAISVNSDEIANDYRESVQAFQNGLREELSRARIDYVALHTGMPYDKALTEYLLSRRGRF